MSKLDMAIPVEKNQELTLTVLSETIEGQGIARENGFAIFIPGALQGETVLAHIIKVTKTYAVAKLLEVQTPSDKRIVPACPVYEKCGGCTLQHMEYSAQLALKRQTVYDALKRLGGIEDPNVLSTQGMEEPWRYRNKGSFPLGGPTGCVSYGLFSMRSHRLVPVADCLIHDEAINSVASRVQEWANAYHVSAYDETAHRGLLRHIMVRITESGELMAVLVTTKASLPHQAELIELLNNCSSIYLNVNSKDTNVIFSYEPGAFRLLSGKETLSETLCGLSFSVSPQSFLQVNHLQTERLYRYAVDLLDPKPTESILDGYCGIGTISLLAASKATSVTGIEQVPEAVSDAGHNAERNGIQNTRFIAGNMEDILPSFNERLDAAVIDPPRKGCEPEVLSALTARKDLDRIVYVSCNPATLARDVKLLTAGGFTLSSAKPFDMFPQTGHVETVVLMSRK